MIRNHYKLPAEKEAGLRRAYRLAWISLFFLLTIITAMYAAMGTSQAMKTAWIEDVLSLVPPLAFIAARKLHSRSPSQRFPYGFHRAHALSFLVAASAVLVVGLFILGDAVHSLISQERPTLGHTDLWGVQVWSGWVMIAALIYSIIPPVVLGHMKVALAHELYEKTLYADGMMNKADWMTGLAGVLGVIGIGMGYWWADAVAAAIISLDVCKDGVTQLRRAISVLLNQRPTEVGSDEPLTIDLKISESLLKLSYVNRVEMRLREEGHIISGEVFVTLKDDVSNISEKLRELEEAAMATDWRLHGIIVTCRNETAPFAR